MSFQKYVSGKPVVQMYLLDNSFRQLLIEPSSTTHVSGHLLRVARHPRLGLLLLLQYAVPTLRLAPLRVVSVAV